MEPHSFYYPEESNKYDEKSRKDDLKRLEELGLLSLKEKADYVYNNTSCNRRLL